MLRAQRPPTALRRGWAQTARHLPKALVAGARHFALGTSPPTIWTLAGIEWLEYPFLAETRRSCAWWVSHDRYFSWRTSRTRWWNSIRLTKMARASAVEGEKLQARSWRPRSCTCTRKKKKRQESLENRVHTEPRMAAPRTEGAELQRRRPRID